MRQSSGAGGDQRTAPASWQQRVRLEGAITGPERETPSQLQRSRNNNGKRGLGKTVCRKK